MPLLDLALTTLALGGTLLVLGGVLRVLLTVRAVERGGGLPLFAPEAR